MSMFNSEDFRIELSHHFHGNPLYRVVYKPTGEESALYCASECERIIQNAIHGALLGSFLS